MLGSHAGSAALPRTGSVASFLGTVETRLGDVRPLSVWLSVQERASREADADFAHHCSRATERCAYRDWTTFIETLQGSKRRQQLQKINDYLNRLRYVPDDANYAVEDFWASPGEFLIRGGDCEDYAISKYFSLKRLGWNDQELRVVLVIDTATTRPHAVLIARDGDRTWLLDSRYHRVIDVEEAAHYQPLFSFNATAWWHHQRS
jgi:predicted transglutaminase-like cysteine proteinase